MEELLKQLMGEKTKRDVWDNYVPIITKDNIITAFLTDEISSPDNYNELYFTLLNAKKGDEAHIHINTPGGILSAAFMIIDAFEKTQAKVICHLTGDVASAGTIIALAADEIRIAPFTSFMVHNYSSGVSGKGGELKALQKFNDEQLEKVFNECYKGFLTQKEIDKVIEDKDIWLNDEEVKARLKARENNDIATLEQIAKEREERLKG